QPLDPAKPDAKAVFYVTPLAKGWLRHECLEVLLGGRKVQEMPLATKVTTQHMTWALLILAFLVPWVLYNYVQNSPLETAIVGKTPGEALAIKIAKVVPDTPALIKDNVPFIHDRLIDFREHVIGGSYNLLWTVSNGKDARGGIPLPFFSACVLLLLAILSWFAH